jgi:hypothetical protein
MHGVSAAQHNTRHVLLARQVVMARFQARWWQRLLAQTTASLFLFGT